LEHAAPHHLAGSLVSVEAALRVEKDPGRRVGEPIPVIAG
jgi:hypothetical protein